ncbi:MAG TPA: hypothetical protein DCS43_16305 [Verrucomicrobia bacterium]|nr:hypothetical protein [Verrucomicrobiota bacterium]
MKNEKPALPNVQHKDDVVNVKAWIDQYGSYAVSAVLIVLIALTAGHMLKNRRQSRMAEASQRLAVAQTAADLESIIADFRTSDVAPLAHIALAKINFENGEYDLALSQYDAFLKQWPDHEMKTTAQLGRIVCIEARGQAPALQEAATAFAAFAAENKGHFLAPQAIFGQARCFEQLGDLEKARTLYEDFIASHPDDLWNTRAEELLETLKHRLKQ